MSEKARKLKEINKSLAETYEKMDEILEEKAEDLKEAINEHFKSNDSELTAVVSESYGNGPDGKKFKCYHRVDIKKGEETLYYITFVWQDIDVKTGNIHSQFGKVQIYKKVGKENNEINEAENEINETENEINEYENNSKKWIINYSEGKNDSKGYFNFDEAPYVGDGEKFIDDIISGFQSFLDKSKFKKQDHDDKNDEWNILYDQFCEELKIKRNIIKCVLDKEKIGKLDDGKTVYSNNNGKGKNKEYFWIDSKNKEEDSFSILLSTAFLDPKTGNIYTEFGKIQFCKSIDGKKDFNEIFWEINYPIIGNPNTGRGKIPEDNLDNVIEEFKEFIEKN